MWTDCLARKTAIKVAMGEQATPTPISVQAWYDQSRLQSPSWGREDGRTARDKTNHAPAGEKPRGTVRPLTPTVPRRCRRNVGDELRLQSESVGGPIPDCNCPKKSLALAGWCARMGGLVA